MIWTPPLHSPYTPSCCWMVALHFAPLSKELVGRIYSQVYDPAKQSASYLVLDRQTLQERNDPVQHCCSSTENCVHEQVTWNSLMLHYLNPIQNFEFSQPVVLTMLTIALVVKLGDALLHFQRSLLSPRHPMAQQALAVVDLWEHFSLPSSSKFPLEVP